MRKSAARHGRAKSHPDHQSQTNQRGGGNAGSNAAQIVDPLPHSQAHDVEHHQNDQKQQRRYQRKGFVVRQTPDGSGPEQTPTRRRSTASRSGRTACCSSSSTSPTESRGSRRRLPWPTVDATFSGIAVGQFDDGDALRPEEQEQRDDPQPDRDSAVGRNRRDHIQVEDGDHEQQNQVGAAENALEVRLVRIVRGQSSSCSIRSGHLAVFAHAATMRRAGDAGATRTLVRYGHYFSVRSCCALASAGATSSNADRCLSISASVCWTEIVHCSSHQ